MTRRRLLLVVAVLAVAAGGWAAYARFVAAPRAHRRGLDAARAAIERGDWAEVERAARELDRRGKADDAALLRGLASARQGVRAAEKAERHGRELLAARAAGWLAAPARLAGAAAWLTPDGRHAPGWRRDQEKANAAAAYHRALGFLAAVDADGPHGGEAAAATGEALLRLRELGEPVRLVDALTALTRAVERRPDLPEAHRGLASLFLDLQAIEQALKHLGEWARLAPAEGRPWRWIGYLSDKHSRDVAEVVRAYQAALDRELPEAMRVEVTRELAEVLMRGQGDYRGALAALGRCPAPHDAEPVHRTLRAECLVRLGRTAEATAELEQALRQAPGLPQALLLRARLHVEQDNPRAALAPLEALLRLDAHDVTARQRLAEAYALLGEAAKAEQQRKLLEETRRRRDQVRALHKEALRRPYDESPRCEIAQLLLDMSYPEEARLWVRAALACNPDSPRARQLAARLPGGWGP